MAVDAVVTCRVAADDGVLLVWARSIAHSFDRPVRPLHLQALLQLPRVADEQGLISMSVAHPELVELAKELPVAAEWLVPDSNVSLHSLCFSEVDANRADFIMKRFHYLRSPRTNSRAYGLSMPSGQLVAVCLSSTLDVGHLSRLLVANDRSSQLARVISRVFVFEGAPRNCISHLLSRAVLAERSFGVTDFVTYVNPNMGFTGSSYRASGWHLLGDEPGTRYRYLDRRYITDRRLALEFGKYDDEGYHRILGARFTVSKMSLAPLLVFHRGVG